MKFAEMQAKVASAVTKEEADAVIAEYNKTGKAEAKALAEAIKIENEMLAGAREALTEKFRKIVIGGIDKAFTDKEHVNHINTELGAVKATGYKVTYDVATGMTVASLIVPAEKAKTRTSTGTRGASRDLDAIYKAHATDADKAKMIEAEAKDEVASKKLNRKTKSNAWRVKDIVAKRVEL